MISNTPLGRFDTCKQLFLVVAGPSDGLTKKNKYLWAIKQQPLQLG
jgi:hypothetical protein